MSKSHVTELCHVYKALFDDAMYAFPELVGEFRKDFSHLQSFSSERGLHAITVDLPAAGKHLDRCLDSGLYKRSGIPLTKRFSNRTEIPEFLRGLYLKVFDENGSLKGDCDIEAVLFLRQFLYLGKKVKLDCSFVKVTDTIRDFYELDNSLPLPEEVWNENCIEPRHFAAYYTGFTSSELYLPRLERRHARGDFRSPIEAVANALSNLDVLSGILSTSLGGYCYREWRFRHGPGAIAECVGPTNKYSWQNWSNRLENGFPIADCGFHSYGAWASNSDETVENTFFDEPYSRLIAVPKTQQGPRLIAAEPAAHQWCQQNIWNYFCTRVRNSWIGDFIRFRDQSLNQSLCLESSRNGDLITVDLSAASDRVTPHFVGQLFRHNKPLLLALQACRTTQIMQLIDSASPGLHQLRKFSTMGSACTFPVQSLGFLAIALSVYFACEERPISVKGILTARGKVSVFGDDIIVPKSCWDLLQDVLELLHFQVNHDKSFTGSNFRESCGVDAFRGVDVTPVYWRQPCSRTPESIASAVEVRNSFHKKFFLATAEHIASTLPMAMPLVSMDSGVVGLKSFVKPEPQVLNKTRWNEELQRTEVLVPVVTTKARRLPTNDDSALHQYFTEAPSPYDQWEHGVAQRPTTKIRRRWVPIEDLTS